jgi:hypothetical protein
MTLTADQFLILCGIVGGGIFASWAVFLVVLRGHPEILRTVFVGGFVLRMVTICFIVGSASILAAGKVATPEVFTILSGIAGFVLGGIHKTGSESEQT